MKDIKNLKELTKEFLKENDLTVAFMSRQTGISNTSLSLWLHDERQLTPYAISAVKEFLTGSFLIPIEEIIKNKKRNNGLRKNKYV